MMNWELIVLITTIVLALCGFMVATMKWLLDKYQAHLDSRFQSLEKAQEGEREQWQRIERDLLLLRAELPNEYVRREDWIRFGSTMEAKLDGLGAKIDSVKDRLNARN